MGDSRDVLCFHLMTSRKVNHASVRHRGPLATVFVFVFIFYFFGLKGDKTLCKNVYIHLNIGLLLDFVAFTIDFDLEEFCLPLRPNSL